MAGREPSCRSLAHMGPSYQSHFLLFTSKGSIPLADLMGLKRISERWLVRRDFRHMSVPRA